MHSKWQIWDFFSVNNREILKNKTGVIGFNCFDPLSTRLVKDFLFKAIDESVVHYKISTEVTKDWLIEEFQTLSLFGNNSNFFIHEAHNLNQEIFDLILNLDLSDRFVLLNFESENTLWKKFLKNSDNFSLQIEAPRFWEMNKLLDFVCQYLKLPLHYEAKNWIMNIIENDFSSFYNACYLIKLNHPEDKEVTLKMVEALLTVERVDQFALASSFSRKKKGEFYKRILSLEGDFEKARSLFNFMQSHLVKLSDTSYLSQKNRLTQYDKELQGSAKLWTRVELAEEIKKMNKLEILSKKKDSNLWHQIKLESLRYF